jgi:drug/metabolite transporter (DMT)-like permease
VSAGVLGIVLIGALLHAAWNLLIKSRPNTRVATAGLYIAAGAIALAILPWIGLPSRASWPYLAASTVAELIYGVLLALVYEVGDLSHAYPLMRGTAPLLVALGSGALVGESLSRSMWIGVAIVSGGILSLWFEARSQRRSARATRLALLNACAIATYTMIDGLGVRVSGRPASYSLALFVLIAGPWAAWALLRSGAERGEGAGRGGRDGRGGAGFGVGGGGRARAHAQLRAQWAWSLVGGAGMLGSYGLALWAMTRAPVAAVAAARESSIVFSAVLGALVLHERVTPVRALAALIITVGVWIVRAA